MASKLEFVLQLADREAREITGSQGKWQAFLQTVARMYKYPYVSQLLIHAQRPEATACAGYETWSRKMGRFVRQGARGIALVDTSGDNPRLRYVFDVSDTGGGPLARTPNPWQLRQEHDDAVRQALLQRFEVGGLSLADQLEETARFIVDDYWYDHRQDLLDIVDGSFAGDYDGEESIRSTFCEAAAVSVGYVLLSRCDLEPEQRYEPADFMQVFEFNTPRTAHALGSCISASAAAVLREVELAVRKFDRTAERSQNHEQTQLYPAGQLPDPRPQTDGAVPAAPGQIRQTAEDLPGKAPSGAVEQPAPVREAVPPSAGDRPDSPTAAGGHDAPADERSGGDAGAESPGSHAVGQADELPEGPGGGSDPAGADLQLTQSQISFFQAEPPADRTDPRPEAALDRILQLGSNTPDHRMLLVSAWSRHSHLDEKLLKTVYHGGFGLREGGIPVSAWYGPEGIHLAEGRAARFEKTARIISWAEAGKRIGDLLEQGLFATEQEVAAAPEAERQRAAEKLWYLASDLSEAGIQKNLLPDIRDLHGGFQEETRQIAGELLQEPALGHTVAQMQTFLDAYREDRRILRFQYHRPEELLRQLTDLEQPGRGLPSHLADIPAAEAFITEDELDAALAGGSGTAGGKGRIYAFFTEDHTLKEKTEFLKSEYGVGGRSHALSGAPGSSVDYDGRGLRFQKQACKPVSMTWEKTVHRLEDLIRQDRYLTAEEKKTSLTVSKTGEKPEESKTDRPVQRDGLFNMDGRQKTQRKASVRERLKMPSGHAAPDRKSRCEMEVR